MPYFQPRDRGMTAAAKLRGYVSLAHDFRAGKTSPRDFLDETLRRIDEDDATIGAFVVVDREGALTAVEASSARWRRLRPAMKSWRLRPARWRR